MTAALETSPASWTARGLDRWWLRWPSWLRRWSLAGAHAAIDGHWLVAFPRVAALAPPAALAAGLYVGWKHPWFTQVPTESILLLGALLVIGTLSGALGLLLVLGFAVGDFFLFRERWTFCCPTDSELFGEGLLAHILRERVSLLVLYVLLAGAGVLLPLAVKGLVVQLRLPWQAARSTQLGVGVVGHAVTSVVLVYLWAQSVPVLIRPVFVWPRGTPSVSAMSVVQTRLAPLLVAVVLASLLRMALQIRTVVRPETGLRLDEVELALSRATLSDPWWERARPITRTVAAAAVTTLMMSGLFTDWRDAAVVGVVVLLLGAVRYGTLPLPVGGWQALTDRVPLLLRMAIGMALTLGIVRTILAKGYASEGSFRPVTIGVVAAMVVFFLVNPVVDRPRDAQEVAQ